MRVFCVKIVDISQPFFKRSMITFFDQRVGVFIDVENLYHSAKKLYNARVNFKTLLEDILEGRKVVRAIAYVIRTPSEEEKPFFEALSRIGIETKIKDLQIYGGFRKADWDVGIAVDMIRMAPLLDTLILLSGDGDFVPVVEYLQNRGKQVEVVAFLESTSLKLKERADKFFNIGSSKKYLIKKRKKVT